MSHQMVYNSLSRYAVFIMNGIIRYDSLNSAVKNRGEKPKWTAQDAFILIYKYVDVLYRIYSLIGYRIASLPINDDTEIDWKALNDSDWDLWSAHQLQRRWKSLKKTVKGHETLPFKGMSAFMPLLVYVPGS